MVLRYSFFIFSHADRWIWRSVSRGIRHRCNKHRNCYRYGNLHCCSANCWNDYVLSHFYMVAKCIQERVVHEAYYFKHNFWHVLFGWHRFRNRYEQGKCTWSYWFGLVRYYPVWRELQMDFVRISYRVVRCLRLVSEHAKQFRFQQIVQKTSIGFKCCIQYWTWW